MKNVGINRLKSVLPHCLDRETTAVRALSQGGHEVQSAEMSAVGRKRTWLARRSFAPVKPFSNPPEHSIFNEKKNCGNQA